MKFNRSNKFDLCCRVQVESNFEMGKQAHLRVTFIWLAMVPAEYLVMHGSKWVLEV